jgi:hypothetical protein
MFCFPLHACMRMIQFGGMHTHHTTFPSRVNRIFSPSTRIFWQIFKSTFSHVGTKILQIQNKSGDRSCFLQKKLECSILLFLIRQPNPRITKYVSSKLKSTIRISSRQLFRQFLSSLLPCYKLNFVQDNLPEYVTSLIFGNLSKKKCSHQAMGVLQLGHRVKTLRVRVRGKKRTLGPNLRGCQHMAIYGHGRLC